MVSISGGKKSFFQVDRSKQGTVVGLGAPAGAAVLRRLEQRRRLHKVGLSTLRKFSSQKMQSDRHKSKSKSMLLKGTLLS